VQNATSFMTDFYNLMSFSVALAYAITMLSAIRIRKKHPEWVSPFHLKGGNFTRGLAFVLALIIAFFCCCGQGAGSWKCWGIFMGIGAVIWLWMVLVRWKNSSVVLPTPDGNKEY
jgi:APA family basic amino acid/polyamine antiporter